MAKLLCWSSPIILVLKKVPVISGPQVHCGESVPPRWVPRPCCGDAHLNNSYIMFEWLGIFSNQIGNGIISRMWLRTIPLSDDLKRWLQLSPHRQVEKFRDQYCTSTPRYWFLAVGWVLGATLYEIWNRKNHLWQRLRASSNNCHCVLLHQVKILK